MGVIYLSGCYNLRSFQFLLILQAFDNFNTFQTWVFKCDFSRQLFL